MDGLLGAVLARAKRPLSAKLRSGLQSGLQTIGAFRSSAIIVLEDAPLRYDYFIFFH
jgi:hypothetical protein